MHCRGAGSFFPGKLHCGIKISSFRFYSFPRVSRLIQLTIIDQSVESPNEAENAEESGSDDDDIEAQIRKEVEGLKPSSAKSRPFQAIRMELPCGSLFLHL